MDKYEHLFGMLCDLGGPPIISEMNDIVETVKRDFLWKKISALDTTKFGRSLILWDVDKNRARTGTDLLALSNPERFTYFIDISDLGKP